MRNPYPLKLPSHTSASGIKTFLSCEAQRAYQTHFVGVPTVPTPVAAAYGTITHVLAQRLSTNIWKRRQRNMPVDTAYVRKSALYGRLYVNNALRGLDPLLKPTLDKPFGPRGESSLPEPIRWFTSEKRRELSDQQYAEQVEERIAQYQGKIFNTLTALGQELVHTENLVDMVCELDFSSHRFKIGVSGDPWSTFLRGQIDQLLFFKDGRYGVRDYKTGYITGDYNSRKTLVHDQQMTIYGHVAEQIYGRPPNAIIIQPLEFSSAYLKEHGHNTLRMLRTRLDRIPEHWEELTKLARDIRLTTYMVVNSRLFSQTEREDVVFLSKDAIIGDLKRNIVEGRFIPRIGPGCTPCTFYELCRVDHASDWDEYKRQQLEDLPSNQTIEASPFLTIPTPQQPELFETGRPKSPYVKVSLKKIRKALLATGQFCTKVQLKGSSITELRFLMIRAGICDCVKAKLIPKWLVRHFENAATGSVNIPALACENCVNENCLHKQQRSAA